MLLIPPNVDDAQVTHVVGHNAHEMADVAGWHALSIAGFEFAGPAGDVRSRSPTDAALTCVSSQGLAPSDPLRGSS